MKNIARYITMVLMSMMVIPTQSWGQQDPHSTLYIFNPLQFNSAYAGSRGSININGLFRYQWVGFEGAPYTGYLSWHMPIVRQNMGIGTYVVSDNIGAWNNIHAYASYAYSLKLNEKGLRLNLGINAGIDYFQVYYQGLRVVDNTDFNYITPLNKVLPNFGFSSYMYNQRFFVGLSVPRLLQQEINPGSISDLTKNFRHYYVFGGGLIKLDPAIYYRPSVFFKMVENAPLTFDITNTFIFYNRFWAGINYRFHESVGLHLLVNLKSNVYFGYMYEYPINDLRTNQWGTHEVVIGVDLKRNKKAVVSPRYF